MASHTNYWVKSRYNQVVAWGASSSLDGNATYTVDQSVYIIYNNAGASILQQSNFVAYQSPVNRIPVHISP